MRLKGLNLKGLRIFPQSEKTVYPCNHKHGALAAWSHCTDTTTLSSAYNGETGAFKSNLGVTIFDNPFSGGLSIAEKIAMCKSGRARYQVYFATDRWRSPTVLDSETDISIKYPLIPNYSSTIWTQAGVDAGFNVTIGESKPVSYPNHGQELYDISGGLYGYDLINGVPGENDVTTSLIQMHIDWIKDNFGYYPSVASYRNGKTGIYYALPDYFLGARNSAIVYRTPYGYSQKDEAYLGSPSPFAFNHAYAVNMSVTTRMHDVTPRSHSLEICDTNLQDAITNKGWYLDFTHWHLTADTELADYYANQRGIIGINDVVTLDVGEALEYKFLRDMVRRISLYTNESQMVLVVDVKDNDTLPLNTIETSLSVDVDLTGTVLAGKEISGVGDEGIRELGANRFVIEVPYSKEDGFQVVTLMEAATPSYLDFTLPVISSVTKSESLLTVITDKPTNVVLFSATRGGQLYTAAILSRDNTMSLTHSIDVTGIDFSTLDIYIGVITKEKQSVLSNAYQW